MNQIPTMNYGIANGASSTGPLITYFSTVDPTTSDTNYPVGKRWLNTVTANEFILTGFTTSNATVLASWLQLQGGGAVESFVTNVSGPVLPTSGGVINLNASTTTYTNGATSNTVKTEVQASAHALLIGAGTNTPAVSLTPGTTGRPLVSQGASADPAYAVLGVVGGGTGIATQNAYAVLVGGTTATGNMQSLASNGTSGHVLTSNGTSALPTWGSGLAQFQAVVQSFTASGTYTPTTGMKYCIVQLLGGGGGGGGSANGAGGAISVSVGGGGGGSEYAIGYFSAAQIGASQIVTIGAAGTAGTAPSGNGGAGGTSSLGSLITSVGGGGGAGGSNGFATATAGGSAGTGGTGGTFRSNGTPGFSGTGCVGTGTTPGIFGSSGHGASSFFGGGSVTVTAVEADSVGGAGTTVAGNVAQGYGTGGSGALTISTTGTANNGSIGGVGSVGCMVIIEYI